MIRPRFDVYSKVMLTAIATALVWLCLDRTRFVNEAVAQTGQSTKAPEAIKAREFILVDEDGKNRGVWRARRDGTTYLSLLGKEGKPQISLMTYEDGSASLSLALEAGEPSITLLMDADQTQGLCLTDGRGRERVMLGVGNNNVAHVNLCDSLGKPRVNLVVGPDGSTGALGLVDNKGRIRGTFGMGRTGEPNLKLMDDKGRIIYLGQHEEGVLSLSFCRGKKGQEEALLQLTVDDADRPGLLFHDKDKRCRVGLLLTEHGPTLRFLDERGKTMWEAP